MTHLGQSHSSLSEIPYLSKKSFEWLYNPVSPPDSETSTLGQCTNPQAYRMKKTIDTVDGLGWNPFLKVFYNRDENFSLYPRSS